MMTTWSFIIDETSGKLWKFPKTSILASSAPATVSAKSWTDHFDNAKRDSYTFVNAEVIGSFTASRHLLKAATYTNSVPIVVSTKTVSIAHPKFSNYGGSFHWPISFEASMHLATDLKPKFGDVYQQRPSPADIFGAVQVAEYAVELFPSEREFLLRVSCAPYIFRDCSEMLEQYWRSTRLHKECHPSRIAIQTRMGRESELRRILNVNTLLEKAKDPEIEFIVRKNASRGMRVLGELLEITNDAGRGSRRRKREHAIGGVCFFGVNGLPLELQSVILSMCVKAIFAYPDSVTASRTFAALRSTCKLFQSESCSIGNRLISGAHHELNSFVLCGKPLRDSRMSGLASWTYREFGCPPSLLLHGLDDRNDAAVPWLAYLRARTAAGLAANVCTERAKRFASNATRERSIVQSSARMAKLLGIVTASSSTSVS